MITTYSYDAANQLVAEESASGTITYTYDPNGNMTVRDDGGARTTYTWDAENRLVGVALAAGGPVTMTHDADGLRRRLETPTEDTLFVWDDQNVLLETDDQGATQASYTLAPRRYGDLLSQRRGSDSRFYLFDGLGSTDRLLDEDEAVTDSYTYEAFGTARASSGTTPNPYQYVGRLGYQFDGATGLHYIRARHYDAHLGAFASPDPLRQGHNWFAYTQNRPTGASDSSGLSTDVYTACAGGVMVAKKDEWVHLTAYGGSGKYTRSGHLLTLKSVSVHITITDALANLSYIGRNWYEKDGRFSLKWADPAAFRLQPCWHEFDVPCTTYRIAQDTGNEVLQDNHLDLCLDTGQDEEADRRAEAALERMKKCLKEHNVLDETRPAGVWALVKIHFCKAKKK